MTLDEAIQLHEVVEIRYNVNHYRATLLTRDGNLTVASGAGPSVLSALGELDRMLDPVENIDRIRGVPVEVKDDAANPTNLKCCRCDSTQAHIWWTCPQCGRLYCGKCVTRHEVQRRSKTACSNFNCISKTPYMGMESLGHPLW